jgi:hypothetical protein
VDSVNREVISQLNGPGLEYGAGRLVCAPGDNLQLVVLVNGRFYSRLFRRRLGAHQQYVNTA